MLAYLGVGLVVGALARIFAPDRELYGRLFYFLLSIAGAFVGGFAAQGLGLSGPYEPAGFALSFVCAMLFVGVYHAVRRRLSLP